MIIYALHLLCAFLRDPGRIGGWLLRLVAGWHEARRDAEMVRQDMPSRSHPRTTDRSPDQTERVEARAACSNPELQDLHPVQVTLVGAEDETPQRTSERPCKHSLTSGPAASRSLILKSRRGNARPHSLPQRAYGPVCSTNHFSTSLR